MNLFYFHFDPSGVSSLMAMLVQPLAIAIMAIMAILAIMALMAMANGCTNMVMLGI